jgi:hypothetical protein
LKRKIRITRKAAATGTLSRDMGLLPAGSFNKYFTVGILTGINLLNYMDRYTIAGKVHAS